MHMYFYGEKQISLPVHDESIDLDPDWNTPLMHLFFWCLYGREKTTKIGAYAAFIYFSSNNKSL
jgi:hypothetical protein